MLKRSVIAVCALFSIVSLAPAQSVLEENDIIALCGDSITEQKLYSAYIESYLTLCQPTPVKVLQFGWSGETAPTFLGRMTDDVLIFKPTLATTCYGMNDGGYRAIDDQIRTKYRDAMTGVVEKFKKAGVRVIVGTPGPVDTVTFKRQTPAAVYNENLKALGEEGRAIAEKNGELFADVFRPMRDAMEPAKAKYGEDYPVAGGDGVHPGANGHLAMAYSFLKAMKLDGDIGTIDVDLAANKATATAGHQVVSVDGGNMTIESTRFPFCFTGDQKAPQAATGILPFLPFNQDLNRYVLKVSGPATSYKVTWGAESKTFSAEQLKTGVNLADEFLANPFLEAFSATHKAVLAKQVFETKAFKSLIRGAGSLREDLKNDAVLASVVDAVKTRHAELSADVAKSIKPVRHTLIIEAAQ